MERRQVITKPASSLVGHGLGRSFRRPPGKEGPRPSLVGGSDEVNTLEVPFAFPSSAPRSVYHDDRLVCSLSPYLVRS